MSHTEQDERPENPEQASQGSSSVARRVSKKPRLGNLSFTHADLLKFRGPRGWPERPGRLVGGAGRRAHEQARTERERREAKLIERADRANREFQEYIRLLEPYLGILDAAKTADREKAER